MTKLTATLKKLGIPEEIPFRTGGELDHQAFSDFSTKAIALAFMADIKESDPELYKELSECLANETKDAKDLVKKLDLDLYKQLTKEKL